MERTTVYLPEETKRALEHKARAEGRSEAEIIRLALAQATAEYQVPPKPRLGLFKGPGNTAKFVDELLVQGFGRK